MNREYLMLAKTWDGDPLVFGSAEDWLISEKLDGMRAFWDGGISIGLANGQVPYGNIGKRTGEACTGMWSRYGNVIHAPDYWVASLPRGVPLDGELFCGRGQFQQTMSVCKRHRSQENDERWKAVEYRVFDAPIWDVFSHSGLIRNPQFSIRIANSEMMDFAIEKGTVLLNGSRIIGPSLAGEGLIKFLDQHVGEYHSPVDMKVMSVEGVMTWLDEVVSAGGEGLMARSMYQPWSPYRVAGLLKVLKMYSSVATVCGHTDGKGKHLGRMGALIVSWHGLTFQIGVFYDEEREKGTFPIGSKIKFEYKNLTEDGVPRHAQYKR